MIRTETKYSGWVIPLACLAIFAIGWNLDLIAAVQTRSHADDNVKGTGELTGDGSLTYLYQSRLNQIGWLKEQCELCRSQIHADQTVFPYLQVPPLLEEHDEQFNQPLNATRIAVLHVWSSTDELPPPFFQYWLASALANDRIADFFIFVPDQDTAARLQRLIPKPTGSSSSNVRLHVVGKLQDFYHSHMGDVIDRAKINVIGSSISKLKPMLGCVFEEYIGKYSHWAWADMDLILGNLTKFLGRPIAEGYDVITMSAVDKFENNNWTSHVCYGTALAGQLTVLANTNKTRNYFRHDNFTELRHMYDEKPFPALLRNMGIRIAHVFAQVTDQLGRINNAHFNLSRRGLFKVSAGHGSYEYEAGLVHMMQAKRLLRPSIQTLARNYTIKNSCNGSVTRQNKQCFKAFEDTVFPPFAWETTAGYVLKFPVRPSAPWEPYDGPTNMLGVNVVTRE